MPNIVRNLGDLKHTKNIDGQEVRRESYLFLQNYGHLYCLNTDTHFIYKSRRLGSTTLCTCGSPATVVGYHAYRRVSSYVGNEVLACHYYIQYGVHADGSH